MSEVTLPVLGLIASTFMVVGALSWHVRSPATLMEGGQGQRHGDRKDLGEGPALGSHAPIILDTAAWSSPQRTPDPDDITASRRTTQWNPVNL